MLKESSEAFRNRLVQEGVVEEMLRALVTLGEKQVPADDAVSFLKENLFSGSLLPLYQRAKPSSYEVCQENAYLHERVADLKLELQITRDHLKAKLPEGTLTISKIAAFDVPDVDAVGGISDPFVRVSLLDVPNLDDDGDEVTLGRDMDPVLFAAYCEKHGIAAQTSAIKDSANPSWPDEVLSIVLPAGTPRPPRVLVRVWDDDVSKSDDPIASAEVQLEPKGGSFEKLVLKGRDGLPDVTISFEYAMLECAMRQELPS